MFTPQPKTGMEIVEELFDSFEQHLTFEGCICKIHSQTMMGQDLSIKALVKVLNAGYTVDLLLQDGSEIINTNVNDARVKLVYNTSVTPPNNGIVKWQPYSPLRGQKTCVQSSDL